MLTTNSVKTKSRHYSKQENQHKKNVLTKEWEKEQEVSKINKVSPLVKTL